MNRQEAKRIAENIKNEQLNEMLKNARLTLKNEDWKEISKLNKGVTKGVAWNIMAKDFDVNENYNTLIKINMIREFAEFLPEELRFEKKESCEFNMEG